MVDNRTAVVVGTPGGINFKSGDISGTAARTSDDRASQGTEYFLQEGEYQEETNNSSFIDRSTELRASLNSLALINVVSILRNNKRNVIFDDEYYAENLKTKKVKKIEENKQEKDN